MDSVLSASRIHAMVARMVVRYRRPVSSWERNGTPALSRAASIGSNAELTLARTAISSAGTPSSRHLVMILRRCGRHLQWAGLDDPKPVPSGVGRGLDGFREPPSIMREQVGGGGHDFGWASVVDRRARLRRRRGNSGRIRLETSGRRPHSHRWSDRRRPPRTR